jgi:subtilisin-like proprotein convertase family protein
MKKITFLKSIIIAIALMFSSFSYSQERTCGMEAYMEEQMKNPEFARQYNEMQAQFKIEVEKVLKNDNVQNRGGANPLVIPVAVHFPAGSEANRACLEALAQNQVDILNADFTGNNADIALWPAASVFYPGTNTGSNNIFFCLATQNHPAGTDPQLVAGGPAVTIGYNFGNGGDVDANWSGYMNFVVKNIGGGLLGYSPLGGSIAAGQAVVMNTFAFGSGAGCPGYVPGAPYNLGRTVTHELGHFYNLNHTFTGSCGTDDGIADTPNIANDNGGCPANGSINACVAGQKALTMNYMDYVNDACMYMFTQGQAAVSTAYLNVLQAQFKPNVTDCSFGPGFSITAVNNSIDACTTSGSTQFNLTYNTFEGFIETTTFSASGAPAGSNVTFSPITANSDNTSVTMTVSNLGSVAIGSYAITVSGTSSSITETLDLTLNVFNGSLTSSVLALPANGANNVSVTPTLTWNDNANALSYFVEIATDNGFVNIVESSTVQEPSYSLVTSLTGGTQYYWRVTASNPCLTANASQVFSFTTADVVCDAFASATNLALAIPDGLGTTGPANGPPVTHTINVPDSGTIIGMTVNVDLSHTYIGDLIIRVIHPDGVTFADLWSGDCGNNDNLNVTFDDEAGAIVCASPTVGTFVPFDSLSLFNGLDPVGDWQILLADFFQGDTGVLNDWTLNICYEPSLSLEENIISEFSIFPNPNNGEFTIKLNSNSGNDIKVDVYDIRGRKIFNNVYSNTPDFTQTINLNNVQSGVYLVNVNDGNGQVTKKIIVD